MNDIQKLMVRSYETESDISPQDLLNAGWNHKQLAIYVQCCSVLRAISIFYVEAMLNGGMSIEPINQKIERMMRRISSTISALIDYEITFSNAVVNFLRYTWRGTTHCVCSDYYYDRDIYSDDGYIGTLYASDSEIARTVSFLIGKYIKKGYMFDGIQVIDYSGLSVDEAESLLKEFETKKRNRELYSPSIEDFSLIDFESYHVAAKNVGKYECDIESFDNHIDELKEFLDDPLKYKIAKKVSSTTSFKLSIGNSCEKSLSEKIAKVSLTGLREQATDIYLVREPKQQKPNESYWIRRPISKLIISAIVQDKNVVQYKERNISIDEVELLSKDSFDIIFGRVFDTPSEIKTVFVYSFKQISDIETRYESVTAYVRCSKVDDLIPIDVYYDSETNKYFINEVTYSHYAKTYGLPMMRLKPYVQPRRCGEMSLADMSALYMYGYTVSENDGLTQSQRQSLLSNLMDSNLMSKVEMKNHIEWLLHTHESNPMYTYACRKWTDDLRFINNYKIDEQRAVWGKFQPR